MSYLDNEGWNRRFRLPSVLFMWKIFPFDEVLGAFLVHESLDGVDIFLPQDSFDHLLGLDVLGTFSVRGADEYLAQDPLLAIFVLTTVQLHPFLIGIYKFGVMAASSYFSMTVIELATLRFLIVFVWKRVPPIQDQFTVMFLTALNILISCLVSGSRFQTMEDLGYDAQFLGADSHFVPQPALKMR